MTKDPDTKHVKFIKEDKGDHSGLDQASKDIPNVERELP